MILFSRRIQCLSKLCKRMEKCVEYQKFMTVYFWSIEATNNTISRGIKNSLCLHILSISNKKNLKKLKQRVNLQSLQELLPQQNLKLQFRKNKKVKHFHLKRKRKLKNRSNQQKQTKKLLVRKPYKRRK